MLDPCYELVFKIYFVTIRCLAAAVCPLCTNWRGHAFLDERVRNKITYCYLVNIVLLFNARHVGHMHLNKVLGAERLPGE